VVSEITEIPSKLIAPTETSTVSPAQATANLEQAKKYNEFFTGILPTTECSKGTIACINGKVANCNEQGKFVMTTCEAGAKCFAMPMNNVAGVSVGCVSQKKAGRVLGENAGVPSTPSQTTDSPKETPSTSRTSISEPAIISTSTKPVDISISTSVVLTQRPPTTAITATATFSDPGEVITTLPLRTFTPSGAPPVQTSAAESTPLESTAILSTTQETPTKIAPTSQTNIQPTQGSEEGGLKDGEVVTTLPLEIFTRPPVITGISTPSQPSPTAEDPPPSPILTTTAIPDTSTAEGLRTELPVIVTTGSPEPPAITTNPIPQLTETPATTIILQPAPTRGGADVDPTPKPPVVIPSIPDFDFLTIIPMPSLPNGGATGLAPLTVTETETVTKTERIKEKETIFVTVRG
jgi:hypothetical protein